MASVMLLDDAKARAQEVAALAEKPENWYIVGESTWVPGDRPEYVLLSGSIRAVFSWTKFPSGDLRRHMSVSVRGPHYPNPIVVWSLAHYFGFTGVAMDELGVGRTHGNWAVAVDEKEHCIVVQEEIATGALGSP